jgi:arylsulfatase A-like enzyme
MADGNICLTFKGNTMRSTQSIFYLFLTLCLLLTSIAATPAHAGSKPNIVLILSDDQAWTDYSFMRHPQIQTPHIDKLASVGATFKRGYVPTALCRASLSTIITGRYAHDHGITGNDPARVKGQGQADTQKYNNLTDGWTTLPALLQKQGYLSYQTGKWWEKSHKHGGFTHGQVGDNARHGTKESLAIGRTGIKPIENFFDICKKEDKPFFVWYAPFLPHTPHTPPKALFDKYLKKVDNKFIARYYAMCEWLDITVGELNTSLKNRNLFDNTIFIYLSDNGWVQSPASGKYALRSKQSPYENGVRQPTIFAWKNKIPARFDNTLINSIDIVPTLGGLVGFDTPKDLPGVDLSKLLTDRKPIDRDAIFGEVFAHDVADMDNPQASLVHRWCIYSPTTKEQGRWKLLLTYDGKVGRYSSTHPRTEKRPQLFDLYADPHEKKNLAKDHPKIVAELVSRIDKWWKVDQRKVITKWTD